MRFAKFDLDTYVRTKGLSGGPLSGVVEEEIADVDMIVDEDGRPTRGGLIGYILAYGMMATFVTSMFYFL